MHGAAVQGVVTRSVRDTAGMLDVIAGGESWGPFQPAVAGPYRDAVGQDPGRLRIGVRIPTAITPEPDPEAYAAVEAATRVLTELGHQVEILEEAPFDDAALAGEFLLTWFVYIAYEVADARRISGCGNEGFERDTLVMAALGNATRGPEYVAAVEARHGHARRLTEYFRAHDLLLTPTMATPPPKIGEFELPKSLQRVTDAILKTRTAGLLKHTSIVDDLINSNLGWVPYTQLANITGRPAISLPLHWTADGLPLGVQLVAPLGGESTLIKIAAQVEQAAPWFDKVAERSRLQS